jgi:hypothetical protein
VLAYANYLLGVVASHIAMSVVIGVIVLPLLKHAKTRQLSSSCVVVVVVVVVIVVLVVSYAYW